MSEIEREQNWKERFTRATKNPANRSIFEVRPPAAPSEYRKGQRPPSSLRETYKTAARRSRLLVRRIMDERAKHTQPSCPNCGRDRSEGEPIEQGADDG